MLFTHSPHLTAILNQETQRGGKHTIMKTIRKERRLLRKLIRLSKTTNNKISVDDLPVSPNNYYLSQLVDKKLVIPSYQNSNPFTDGPDYFKITKQGKHYFELRHEDLRSLLFRSVYIPIIVSFVTTCITLALRQWLPHLLGWK